METKPKLDKETLVRKKEMKRFQRFRKNITDGKLSLLYI